MQPFNSPLAERILQSCKERGTKVVAVEEVSRNWFRMYQPDRSNPLAGPNMKTSHLRSSIQDEDRAKRLYTSIAQKIVGHTVKVSIGRIRIEEVENASV